MPIVNLTVKDKVMYFTAYANSKRESQRYGVRYFTIVNGAVKDQVMHLTAYTNT